METKVVTVQNGNYICDIDVSIEEWKKILQDETLITENYKDILIKFYNELEHKSTCKDLGEKYNIHSQSINGTITAFAKAVQQKLNRFNVIGTDGQSTYWIIPMTGKYIGEYFEWTIRPELVKAMEETGMTKIENKNEYQKFKHLLEYFVAHLEWMINKDENTKGYNAYIKTLVDNNKFSSTGQGHKRENIQRQIINWCDYDNGKICINIQFNPKAGYKAKANYLNWESTGLNVIADWKNDNIDALALVEYQWQPTKKWIDLNMNKSVTELGLFDNNEPNDNLKIFFDKFNSLIVEWNKDIQNKRNMKTIKPYIDLLKSNKNLILTGAPGTGKTYLAKQIAKEMNAEVAFVQFHPSFDYTDFVEGLRPVQSDENGAIGFELKNGIFKDFCIKAKLNSEKNIVELYNDVLIEEKLNKFLDEAIENQTEFEYDKRNNGQKNKFIIAEHSDEEYFYAKILNNETFDRQLISKTDVMQILANADKINRATDVQRFFNTRYKYQYTFIFQILELLRNDIKNTVKKPLSKVEKKDFVFIIDEINRGEISKIFGELFFSIDPSYRGVEGKVQTQYANIQSAETIFDRNLGKGWFFVPENVYIIGTMNDIDRSVECFDFAMRRRFTWKEITAEESAKNMNLPPKTVTRMTNLNNAISKIDGLNSSYHIGGAYFLDDKGDKREDYDKIWELRLRPLLFEYLRGMPKSETEKLDKELKIAYENDGQ